MGFLSKHWYLKYSGCQRMASNETQLPHLQSIHKSLLA